MIDVCSVKVLPLAILREELPSGTRIVGTHPLFGPNSGRDGIAGLKTVVCRDGGSGGAAVARFLGRALVGCATAFDVMQPTGFMIWCSDRPIQNGTRQVRILNGSLH